MDFRHPFAGAAAVLSANHISLGFHLYDRFPNIDIPLHVAGGFVAGLFAVCVRNELLRRKKIKRSPWWYDLSFVAGFVVIVAVFWEVHEFVLDAIEIAAGGTLLHQRSVADTLSDLINGMSGGIVAFWLNQKPIK